MGEQNLIRDQETAWDPSERTTAPQTERHVFLMWETAEGSLTRISTDSLDLEGIYGLEGWAWYGGFGIEVSDSAFGMDFGPMLTSQIYAIGLPSGRNPELPSGQTTATWSGPGIGLRDFGQEGEVAQLVDGKAQLTFLLATRVYHKRTAAQHREPRDAVCCFRKWPETTSP